METVYVALITTSGLIILALIGACAAACWFCKPLIMRRLFGVQLTRADIEQAAGLTNKAITNNTGEVADNGATNNTGKPAAATDKGATDKPSTNKPGEVADKPPTEKPAAATDKAGGVQISGSNTGIVVTGHADLKDVKTGNIEHQKK